MAFFLRAEVLYLAVTLIDKSKLLKQSSSTTIDLVEFELVDVVVVVADDPNEKGNAKGNAKRLEQSLSLADDDDVCDDTNGKGGNTKRFAHSTSRDVTKRFEHSSSLSTIELELIGEVIDDTNGKGGNAKRFAHSASRDDTKRFELSQS